MKIPKARRLQSGSWFIQLRLGGVSVPVTAATEKECIRQAGLAKAEYLAGKRKPKKAEETHSPTVGEVLDAYIESRKATRSPATIRGYTMIRRHYFHGVMSRPLESMTKQDWQDACDTDARKFSAKTIKNAWGFIRSAIQWETNTIAPKISLPAIIQNEHLFLDSDEIFSFIDAVHGLPVEIPALLALSSLRRSEIMALRWEHIDSQKGIIHVKGAAVFDSDNKLIYKRENKNRTSTRAVPILIPELRDALKREAKEQGLIVTCNPNTIRERINKVCKDHGLPEVGTHGLRHSFASLAYSLDIPELTTMRIGGWSDPYTVHKIYTHIANKDITKQAEKIAAFYQREKRKC